MTRHGLSHPSIIIGVRAVLFWIGLAAWGAGFGYHWWRPGLWLLDLVAIPVMAVLYSGGFAMVTVALVGGSRRPRTIVVALLAVLTALMALVNPGWRVAPKTWFLLHRPLFEVARTVEPGDDYYGAKLPAPLRFLSAAGRLSGPRVVIGEERFDRPDVRFFPQWIGIPDDAGGYLYSPAGSPAGADLYGAICADPVDLGDGWWMCGMSSHTGL